MGIKKLNKFLSKKKNSIIMHNSMTNFLKYIDHNNVYSEKKIIAIDTSLYLYKYSYSYQNFLMGFINQISKLLDNNIIPIYVFEGTPPPEKNDIIQMRYDKRNKLKNRISLLKIEYDKCTHNNEKNKINMEISRLSKQIIHVNKHMTDQLKEMLDILNIKHINSIGESDGMCAYLYKNKFIDATISDDMDILVSGCNHMIKFDKKQVLHYDLNHILNILNLDYDKFVDMCVIFGCDYIKPIPKLNNDRIYELILSNISLEQTIAVLNNTHINTKVQSLLETNKEINESVLNKLYRNPQDYIKAKNIFIYSDSNETLSDNFEILTYKKKINILKFDKFIYENIADIKKYSYNRIINNIQYINNKISNESDTKS